MPVVMLMSCVLGNHQHPSAVSPTQKSKSENPSSHGKRQASILSFASAAPQTSHKRGFSSSSESFHESSSSKRPRHSILLEGAAGCNAVKARVSTPVPMPGNVNRYACGEWKELFDGSLLWFCSEGSLPAEKIAAFDLDGVAVLPSNKQRDIFCIRNTHLSAKW